jgi:hypothetical protein
MIASVAVGTTSVQVLPAPSGNPFKFIAIGNVGNFTAYLKLTPDAVSVTAANGLPLQAGGTLVCDQDAQKELFNSGVSAICGASGTTTLSVQAY